MKKIILILTSIVFINSINAQSSEISSKYDKISKFNNGRAFVYKSDKVGLIDKDGKEIIKPEYERISPFGKDGIAYTYKKNKVGLINTEGKVIVDNIYDYIGHFVSGNATVRIKNLTGIINKEGKLIVEVKYDKLTCEEGGVIKATNIDGTQVIIKPNN